MGSLDFLKPKKSLEELEEEIEYSKTKRELLQEQAAIKEIEQRMGKGSWKMFSSDGSRQRFSLSKALNWLRSGK